jgi:uncharacterized membrane protein
MQISISNIVKGSFISNAFIAISRYFTRVTNDGGIYEKPLCVEAGINSSPLFQQASFLFLPSGYKGGVAYSELPANGSGDLSWVRAGDAWRTNAEGLVQRVPWNLLTNSNDLSQPTWSKLNITITLNSIANPLNGLVNAQKYTPNTTNALHYALSNTITPAGQTYLMSFYVKANGYTNCRVENASNSVGVWFNLSNGTITSGTGGTITALSNGWYFVTVLSTSIGSATAPLVSFAPSTSLTFAGDGVSGGYVFGAQLVEGSTAQIYFPTTDRLNVPRFDYTYGTCPAALLEPQRTNLCLYSAQLDDATWTKLNSSITANATISPDGITNADKIVEANTTSLHGVLQSITTIASTYAVSFYAKASERNFIQWNNQVSTEYINFDLSSGSVGSNSGVTNPSIQNVGNGWYRCSFTFVSTVVGTAGFMRLIIVTSATSARLENYVGNGTSGLFVWGAQFELGAYVSTYVQTVATTVTRVADSFTRSNVYTNGWISAAGGTWFVELRNNIAYTRDAAAFGLFIDSSSGGITNGFSIRQRGTAGDRLSIQKQVAGIQTFLYLTTTNTTKLAIKWNGTTADIFANGTKVVSATSFTPTAMEFLNASIADVPYFIQGMALAPVPLTDDQCEVLTGLGFDSYAAMASFYQYNLV